ncbi:MAG: hypothetical protein CM15mP120_25910 [Pseudomonadota bacterium]|nr:MAG: hypothetical protein CM15mP120_25910 [Pseudomonadota bacterium]
MKVGRGTSKCVVRAVGSVSCIWSSAWLAVVFIPTNGMLSAVFGARIRAHKNWQVRWLNRTFDVYAINTDQEVIFADGEGFILRFDGWQVTQVQGLLPGQNAQHSNRTIKRRNWGVVRIPGQGQ